MKVILRQDVETLGMRGDVIEVKDGYARNFLFPKDLAVYASKGNLATLEAMRAAIEREKAEKRAEAEKVAEEMGKLSVTITARAGAKGKLYGSVTAKDIAESIDKLSSRPIDRKKVHLKEDIRAVGTYEVAIDVYPEVQAKVPVEVIAEKKETKKEQKSRGAEEQKEKEEPKKKPQKESKENKSSVVSRQSSVDDEEEKGGS